MPFEEHPCFITPPDHQVIRRYMSLEKFISLLIKQSLHFSRSDLLGDPHEGSYTMLNQLLDHHQLSNFCEGNHEQVNTAMANNAAFRNRMKATIYANCWTMQEHESMALWQIYAGNSSGIVIQSTVGNLKQSLSSTPDALYISEIKYTDYSEDIIGPLSDDINAVDNVFNAFLHKRHCYDFESELRVVYTRWENLDHAIEPKLGYFIQTNLNDLINGVFVYSPLPQAGNFLELVKDICAKYNLNKIVALSSVIAPPIY